MEKAFFKSVRITLSKWEDLVKQTEGSKPPLSLPAVLFSLTP